MSEDVYALPDLTKKVRHGQRERKVDLEEKGENEDRGEWEEKIVDIYDTADSLKVHDPDPGTQQDAVQKNTAQEKHGDDDKTKKNLFRVTGLCLLCVLLLAVIIGLVIHHVKLKNNLTQELNEIKTSYNNMTEQKDQLETRFNHLTVEKVQLESKNNNLTKENVQLQIRFDRLQNLTEDPVEVGRLLCASHGLHGFTFDGGLCYNISTEAKTWEESRQYCVDNNSTLMVIKSNKKQDFVVSLKQRLWLGLTDRDQEGEWKWVDATPEQTKPTKSKFWNTGEPNGGTTENCAEVFGGGWNDVPCDTPKRCICERVF